MNESTAMTQQEIFLNLKKNGKDNVLQTIDNCIFVLEHDENLRGTIRFNVLTERDCIVGDVGWERTGSAITERDMSYLKLYFERHYHLNHEKALRDAIRIVANENRFHPIQEYLQALRWDGQLRIPHALHRFLGAEECQFNTECLKIFMLGAISRVFHPGIKFELMLCLVGSQGAGKSSFFRLLAVRDEWFSDDLKKIDDDNVYRKMQGHWIIEMSEMLATASAKSIEEIRSFISRQKETYKVPYDIHPEDRPRQCVFAGTSNSLDFLPLDRAGNRRFLPVMAEPDKAEVHILENEAASRAYIDQMWAEAMEIYRSGKCQLRLPKEMEKELCEYQKQFMQEDTKKELILDYLEHYEGSMVCSRQLYSEALGNDGNPAQWEIREINDIMNNCSDWIAFSNPRHFPEPYRRQKGWEKPDNRGQDFQPITKEQMEQLSLPPEWMER